MGAKIETLTHPRLSVPLLRTSQFDNFSETSISEDRELARRHDDMTTLVPSLTIERERHDAHSLPQNMLGEYLSHYPRTTSKVRARLKLT